MRKFALTFTAVLFCGAIAYAGPESIRSSSKEMKETVAPAPPECDFSWTGFYIGANVGYGWGDAETHYEFLPNQTVFNVRNQSHDVEPDGIVGGGQIGFNWQIGRHFVLGIETDFQGSGMEDTTVVSPIFTLANPALLYGDARTFLYSREDMNWFGTLRGRIGFAPWCRLLIYGTGGLAYGDVDYTGAFAAPLFGQLDFKSVHETSVGWTAGGGLEYAITRHWTLKAEYLHYDLGDQSGTGFETMNGVPNPPFATHFTWETTGNIARGGLNFKF